MTMQPLLEIQNLKTIFSTERGVIRAVDGVSLTLGAGETAGRRGGIRLRENHACAFGDEIDSRVMVKSPRDGCCLTVRIF